MKSAGELAKKYLEWALEQKAKRDQKKPEKDHEAKVQADQ